MGSKAGTLHDRSVRNWQTVRGARVLVSREIFPVQRVSSCTSDDLYQHRHLLSCGEMSQRQSTIYVSGLSQNADEAGLMAAFQSFGEIVDVHIPRHRGNPNNEKGTSSADGSHRGFAFVAFASADEAEGAIDNMHLNEIDGQIVTVTIAKQLPSSQSRNDVSSSGFDSRKAIWEDEVSRSVVLARASWLKFPYSLLTGMDQRAW